VQGSRGSYGESHSGEWLAATQQHSSNQTFRDGRHIVKVGPCLWSAHQRIGAYVMTKTFTLIGLLVVTCLSPILIGLIYVLV
jgi:hypothetical protein